jgi:ABC-type branched-subunit amino acid transport system substrate-binding protein
MKTLARVWILHFLFVSPLAFADTVLRVGINIPLTGPLAHYGQAVINGIELAREESADDFRKIDFSIDDNQYDGRIAVSAFQKHRNIDAVDLEFVWGDIPSLAVAPVAEKTRVPTLAVFTETTDEYRYVIRFLSSHFQYTKAMAEHLHRRGVKDIALIHSQSPYDTNHSNSFALALRPDQSLTVLGSVLPAEEDFRPLILRARKQSFQYLGLYIYPTQVATFFRQARELQLQLPVFGADAFESRSIIRQAHGGMENAIYASHHVEESFRTRYVTRYRDDAYISYAANAFEFAKTLVRVRRILEGRSISSEHILAAFSNLPKLHGVLGAYHYTRPEHDGAHFSFPIVIQQIKGETSEVVH